jgi:hypothetical protein
MWGRRKNLERNFSRSHFVPHQSQWPPLGTKSIVRCEQPVTVWLTWRPRVSQSRGEERLERTIQFIECKKVLEGACL